MKTMCVLALCAAWPSMALASGDSEAMAKDVGDFYAAYRAIPSDKMGGVPDAEVRVMLEPFISPALDKALIDADAAEEVYAAKTKNQEPPLMEGDPFTSNFEGANWYKVGACDAQGAKGRCAVDFTYTDRPPWKPFNWTDTIDLVKKPQGWRIDDIEYSGPSEFGNHGRLSETLKWIVEESKKPVDAD